MNKYLRLLVVFLGLWASQQLAQPAAVRAQDGTPPPAITDDQVNAVAKQLYCPVCENVPLDVCPTQACSQWRATIREKLEAGWTTQQVLDYFAAQYGERVLANPSTSGLSVLIWVIPPVAVALGAGLLWFFLYSQRRSQRHTAPAAPAPPAAPSNDEYVARLEQELKKRQ